MGSVKVLKLRTDLAEIAGERSFAEDSEQRWELRL